MLPRGVGPPSPHGGDAGQLLRYDSHMSTTLLPREEHVEQAYFFHHLRERLATNLSAQEILQQISEEILASTRMPMAVQFLSAELKHSGLLSSGLRQP